MAISYMKTSVYPELPVSVLVTVPPICKVYHLPSTKPAHHKVQQLLAGTTRAPVSTRVQPTFWLYRLDSRARHVELLLDRYHSARPQSGLLDPYTCTADTVGHCQGLSGISAGIAVTSF